ncbi:hypothetical protein MAFF211491_04990 [Ralstonia solanacearum]|nr:hypothetical protein MAFF211491_04990 [Ralstonia solanacearum]BCM11361.1 hypothetical protein MAFF241648_05510 [Ralstonia solanacearum]
MVAEIWRLAGDCSHLPYSRGDAQRIRVATEESVRKVPFNPDEPASLRLRHLAGRPVLDWPPTLSQYDPRGLERAAEFECWKKASDSKVGIAGSYFSFKAGGRTACHSALEARLLRYFDMCPFVVEIRTQYPSWSREKFLRCLAQGRRMPKNMVMTIDFMLTLRIPGYPFALYHGVSGKPAALLSEEKVSRRHGRESGELWQWSATHEVMTELTIPDQEHVNNRRLHAFMLHADCIERHAQHARSLADTLEATKACGPLDRVLSMVGKRFGHDRKTSYRLFAIAHFLGHLVWDHRFPLSPLQPMMLVRSQRPPEESSRCPVSSYAGWGRHG